MGNVVGKVNEVYDYSTKVGTMYGVVVDGNKYGAGKVKPKAGVGDTVSFKFSENGQYKNIDMKTFSVESAATEIEAVAAAAASYGGESSGGRQNSIVRQSSLEYAIRYLNALAVAEAIPGIGKTMKPEDKYNIIDALLVETADRFFNANIKGVSLSGGDVMETSSRAQEAAEAAAGDKNWK